MKKNALLLCSLLVAACSLAQNQNWSWAKQSTGMGYVIMHTVAVDAAGNSFVTGRFCDTLVVGSLSIPTQTCGNVFIVKHDASGKEIFAKWLCYGEGMDIATDPAGNIYIAGQFFGTANFGNTAITATGMSDMFIAKFDPNGNNIWAERAGGPGLTFAYATSLALDAANNCYVTGSFDTSITFMNTTLNGNGNRDIFTAKYDAAGNYQWAQVTTSVMPAYPEEIAVDPSGNCFVTGTFLDDCWFGSTKLSSPMFGLNMYSDPYIAKYSSTGTLLWAKQGAGASYDFGYGIAADAAGNCYVTGYYAYAISFSGQSVNSTGAKEIYLVKYDPAGTVQWVRSAGGPYDDVGRDLAIHPSGDICIAGTFSAPANFGNVAAVGTGTWDVFIARYTPAGNAVSVKTAGGSGGFIANAMAISPAGDCYMGGTFMGAQSFGTTSFNAPSGSQLFVAKLNGLTGIEENTEGAFSVFPNPSSGSFSIKFSDNIISKVEIVNGLGQKILERTVQGAQLDFDLQEAAAGVYSVLLYDLNGRMLGAEKLLIRR